MATRAGGHLLRDHLESEPVLFIILRILSWAVMGLAIGAGQGVRENTREDLRACSLGGFLGGAVGGALFDPVSSVIALGGGLVGRCLADVVVGACIGGSMRLAQQHMVEMSRQGDDHAALSPAAEGWARHDPRAWTGRWRSLLRLRSCPPGRCPLRPRRFPSPMPAAVSRPSLAAFQEKYADRSQAMALAYKSGDFTLKEIAEHFGVQSTTVKRAAEQYTGR